MKVETIEIKDILCIEKLTITPGALTILEGKNATGKTSVLHAIRAVLSGGHDPFLIRVKDEKQFPPAPSRDQCQDDAEYQGAIEAWQEKVRQPTQGEIFLHVVDEKEGKIQIRKRITAKGSSYDIRDNRGRKITRHREYINRIFDSLSLDPIEFLEMPAKQRAALLLQLIDVKIDATDLGKIFSHLEPEDHPTDSAGLIDTEPGLPVLDELEKRFREERQELNRVAKDKDATIRQLETTVTEIADKDWEGEIRTLVRDQEETRSTMDSQKAQATDEFTKEESRAEIAYREQAEASKKRAESMIEGARKEHEANIDGYKNLRDRALKDAQANLESKREAADREFHPLIEGLADKITAARSAREEQVRQLRTREFLAETEKQRNQAQREATGFSTALKEIADLRVRLIDQVPVPGLTVKDGEAYLDDVPFDKANDARKYQAAIHLAKLKSGELGLMLLDRAEIFDSVNWELFTKIAKESGLQIVAARVSDDYEELKVSSSDGV